MEEIQMQQHVLLIGAGSANFGLGTLGDIFKSKAAACLIPITKTPAQTRTRMYAPMPRLISKT
jgi:hypothetical protein